MKDYIHNTTESGGSGFRVHSQMVGAFGEGIVKVIWRRRVVVGVTMGFCVLVGMIYVFFAEPIYKSTSRIYVAPKTPRIITKEAALMSYSSNYLHTQVELIKSKPLLAQVLKNGQIRQLGIFVNSDNHLGTLVGGLEVDVGMRDDIINVSFSSTDAKESAVVANVVVDAYVNYHKYEKRNKSKKLIEILQEEKERYEKELASRQEELLEFKRQHGTLSFENDQGNIIIQKLARLSQALTGAQLEMTEAMATYEAVNSMMGNPELVCCQARESGNATSIAFESEQSHIRNNLAELEAKLANMKRRGTSRHPAIQAVEMEIAQLRHKLVTVSSDFAESYRKILIQRWAKAMEKESRIKQSLQEQQELAMESDAQATIYSMKESQVSRIEDLYEKLDNRIKEVAASEESGGLNINMLEEARPALFPSHNLRSRMAGIVCLISIILSVLVGWVVDWLDPRIGGVSEVSSLLHLPVLGVVPAMPSREGRVACGQKAHLDSCSAAAEAYRSIRTSIYFGANSKDARTLLVTSGAGNDGKSTLVANLGITMAQAGEHTLLLDCDFRRPTIHEIMQAKRETGLSMVMAGKIGLVDAIQRTPIHRLDILPGGPLVANPTELLNSKAFSDIIAQLLERYERIVIDSPPVTPMSDARILAAQCDGTLLVLRSQKTTQQAGEQAVDYLFGVGANVLGVVVNDVSQGVSRYGSYEGRQFVNACFGDNGK